MPVRIFPQTDNTLTPTEKKNGWMQLFDGESLNGWVSTSGQPVPDGTWSIAGGALNCVVGDRTSDIMSAGEYSDFELSADFKIEAGSNSGIKYFFTNYRNGGDLGCEYQIIDDTIGDDAMQPIHRCGSFYDVFAPVESRKRLNPPGEWNTVRIVAQGKKVEHWLNGNNILTYYRGDKAYRDAVAKSKFSKATPAFGMVRKGHILLQYHGGPVSFKNIRIRILDQR